MKNKYNRRGNILSYRPEPTEKRELDEEKPTGIRSLEVRYDKHDSENREIISIQVVFGPHHIIRIEATPSGGVEVRIVATHHGFKADASFVNSELYKIIESVRQLYPNNVIDSI